jgi:hypothetical protein
MRKLSELLQIIANETKHYERVDEADESLRATRYELLRNNLEQALADAAH